MTELAVILGDSQAEGLDAVLGPILARHGLERAPSSWTRAGAGVDEVTEHAVRAGRAKIALVFTGGGNDSLSMLRSPTYREKLATLVGTLRFSGVQEVILVGPFWSDDPSVQQLHDAARAVQGSGIPGARFVDGYRLSRWTPHPPGNLTHWTRNGYAAIARELERAVFERGVVTAIGLTGTLAFLGAAGAVLMEFLYSRADDEV